MSAVNVFIDKERAVVLTEGATYEPDGTLVSIGSKCWPVKGRKTVVTGRGPSWFAPGLAKTLLDYIASIDDFVEGGEAMVDRCIEAAQDRGILDEDPAIDLFVVGWSDRDGAARCAQFTTRAPAGVARFSIVRSVMSPALSEEAEAAIVRLLGPQTTTDYDRIGRAVMEEQRRMPGEIFALGQFLVGGHILRTDVAAKGVQQRLIHTWPEDRVGEKIRPTPRIDPVDHPNVTPMNRAERRRVEKAQRKGYAA